MTHYELDLLRTIKEHNLDLNFLNNKTILFTGAAGLIGKYFIDLILKYNEEFSTRIKVIAMDLNIDKLNSVFKDSLSNDCLSLVAHDISKKWDTDLPIDYIIHAASPANPYFYANYPVETINANYIGSLNMLNLAKEKNVLKYLFVSSGEVYGDAECVDDGFKESTIGIVDCSKSRSCYTEGKRSSETLAHCFYDEYKTPVIITRLCHTYGPTYSPNDTRAIFQFLNNYLNNEDIVMKSEGKQLRSYCYVGDTVSAFLMLMKNGIDNETYNISNNNSVCSIRDIAESLTKLEKNIKLKIELPTDNEKKGFSPFQRAVLDGSKLLSINFEPKTTLVEGLKRTIFCKEEK